MFVCVQSRGILGDAEMRERTAEKRGRRRSRVNPSAFVKTRPAVQVFNNEKKEREAWLHK